MTTKETDAVQVDGWSVYNESNAQRREVLVVSNKGREYFTTKTDSLPPEVPADVRERAARILASRNVPQLPECDACGLSRVGAIRDGESVLCLDCGAELGALALYDAMSEAIAEFGPKLSDPPTEAELAALADAHERLDVEARLAFAECVDAGEYSEPIGAANLAHAFIDAVRERRERIALVTLGELGPFGLSRRSLGWTIRDENGFVVALVNSDRPESRGADAVLLAAAPALLQVARNAARANVPGAACALRALACSYLSAQSSAESADEGAELYTVREPGAAAWAVDLSASDAIAELARARVRGFYRARIYSADGRDVTDELHGGAELTTLADWRATLSAIVAIGDQCAAGNIGAATAWRHVEALATSAMQRWDDRAFTGDVSAVGAVSACECMRRALDGIANGPELSRDIDAAHVVIATRSARASVAHVAELCAQEGGTL